jgi:carboxyl-terminal processing protease
MENMDRGRKALLAISSVLVAFVLLGGVLGRSMAVEGTYSFLKLFNEVLYLVRNNYVEPVKDETLMEGAYRGMLESLDPESEYLTAHEAQRAAADSRNGTADVGVVLTKRRGYAVVVDTVEGSPSQKAKLGTGDVILVIDNKSTLRLGSWEAAQLLQGKPGSEVTLSVIRTTEPRSEEVKLLRKLPAKTQMTARLAEPGTGLVKLGAIQPGDAEKLRKALVSLKAQGAERLVLDLRSNAGPSVEESVKIAALLGSEGIVAKVAERKAGTRELKAPSVQAAWDGPLVVLVDAGTAGAAEVLAAGLRDRRGASLVGEKTWGLGTLQKVIFLPAGDGVRISVGKYLSPDGKEWNGTGLSPDVVQERGEGTGSEDLQLKKGLEVVKTEREEKKAA